MKFPLIRLLSASLLVSSLSAQSISIHLSDKFTQTSASAPAEVTNPYSFGIYLRRGSPSIDMTNWGPAFYLPGSGGTPAGSNFPATPNNGSDYLFEQSFATSSALFSAYPAGSYGVTFIGTTPPPPGDFTAGLAFSEGGFAGAAPRVTGINNGATWSAGVLQVNTSGTTLLDLNTLADFTEYGTGSGTFASIGLYGTSGNVLASANSFHIPSLSYTDSLLSQFAINGALLTSGSNYTIDIHYGILGSAPGSATLDGNLFDGTSAYYMTTRINLTAVPEPGAYAAAAGVLALGWAVIRRRRVAAVRTE